MPDDTGHARIRNERGQWIFTAILAVAGPPGLVLKHDLAEPLLAWPVASAALFLLGAAAIAADVLEYGPGRLRHRFGPIVRTVHLDCLTSVASRTPIGVPQVLIRDAHGHSVRLTTRVGAPQLDRWGPLILRAAALSGATVEPTAARQLDPAGALAVQ
jgi:hypothetical protein